MVGWIVCAGFTMRLRISLVDGWLDCVCRLHHEIKDLFSLWLVVLCVQASPWDYGFLWLHVPPARGSAHERRSGQPHRKGHSRTLAWGTGQSVHQIPIIHAYYSLSTCLLICRDSLHPCSLQSVLPALTGPDSLHPCSQLSVDIFRFPSSMLTTVCPPVLTDPDSLHPCSLQFVHLFWQVQIPFIHAHNSLLIFSDSLHPCLLQSVHLFVHIWLWVFGCVFSLHARTSCGLPPVSICWSVCLDPFMLVMHVVMYTI